MWVSSHFYLKIKLFFVKICHTEIFTLQLSNVDKISATQV